MELSVKDGKVDESGHYISDKTANATKHCLLYTTDAADDQINV